MAKILDTQTSSGAQKATVSSTPSLISPEKLLAIYNTMVKCRMLQQRAGSLFQQGKLDSDLHGSAGREACAASVGVDLQPDDVLSIEPGDWLPAFAKGLPVEIIFRALAPRVDGHSPAGSDEARKHNILESAADQPAVVLDQAERLGAAKKPAIVMVFFQNDGASHRWQKVLSTAAEKKLPILFVQHFVGDRNAKAASTRNRSKSLHALFGGVPVIGVDAADPVALYRVAYEAIIRARQGRGATLLECAAVSIVQSVDPTTNQPLPLPDAVGIMESYLKRKGIPPESSNRQVVAEFTRDLDLATRFLAS